MTARTLAMICCFAGIVPCVQGDNLTKSAKKDAGTFDNAVKKSETVLPYDNTNPVMYDNDWTNDYVDRYLMALASVGDIKLQRMVRWLGRLYRA